MNIYLNAFFLEVIEAYSSKALEISITFDLAISLLRIYPKEIIVDVHKKVALRMFGTVLSVIAKINKINNINAQQQRIGKDNNNRIPI